MNPYRYYSLVSLGTAFVWTLLMLRAEQRNRQRLGLIGAWAAALVLVALWQTAKLPWLADFVQLMMLIWLGAIILLVMAAVTTWNERQTRPGPLVWCVLICTIINGAALLHFLWIATVDAGGV
jgi:peptidoglycan/LPS O-acetylase OafA/YrhL